MLNLINQSTHWPLEMVNQAVSHDTVIVEKLFFTQRGPDRQSERTKQAVRGDQTGGQRGPDRRSERTRQVVREDQTGGLRGPEVVREDQTGGQRGPDRQSEGTRQAVRGDQTGVQRRSRQGILSLPSLGLFIYIRRKCILFTVILIIIVEIVAVLFIF
ncbi:unnamed protein product [Gadus morhua 'NCC']